MPQQHMVIPHYLGSNWEKKAVDVNVGQDQSLKRQDSSSSQASSQDIPLLLPQEAGEDEDLKLNGIDASHDHQMKIIKNVSFPFRKAKVEPLVSDMPMKAFVDDFDTVEGSAHAGMKSLDKEWWEIQERSNLVGPSDESGQVGPCVSCRCQVSPYSLIMN